jgi:hypothetical protein
VRSHPRIDNDWPPVPTLTRALPFFFAAGAFAAEADSLLRLVQPPGAQQRVKGLHTVLNEYVALDARARRRAAFERSFGDDGDVRGCLSRLGEVMDDYLAARSRPAAGGAHPPLAPAGAPAPSAAAAAPSASAAACAQAAAASRPASRKRKSAQPQRRPNDEESGPSSRQLFGRASHGAGHAAPSAGASAATSAAWPLLTIEGDPAGAGGHSRAEPAAAHAGAFSLPALAPLDEEQLGEAIAQRINTVPVARRRAGGAAAVGDGADAAADGASAACAAPRVDEMSVDEIVHSLLNDPNASAMLNSLARPARSGSAAVTPSREPAGRAAAPAAPVPTAHAAPATTADAAAAPRPAAVPAAPAASQAASFPPKVDIDSFLNRLHGKRRAE